MNKTIVKTTSILVCRAIAQSGRIEDMFELYSESGILGKSPSQGELLSYDFYVNAWKYSHCSGKEGLYNVTIYNGCLERTYNSDMTEDQISILVCGIADAGNLFPANCFIV